MGNVLGSYDGGFKHIKYGNKYVEEILDWLECQYPKHCDGLCINVMNGYGSVGGQTGSGFGVYLNGERADAPIIMIAGIPPEELATDDDHREFFCKTILHEFRHHVQYTEDREKFFTKETDYVFADKDADNFAEEQYKRFIDA